MTRTTTAGGTGERNVVKNVFKGSIGNLIEWYDWYAYTAFTIYFAASFFPKGNPTTQFMQSAAIFAVGFLMRPLGGWLLGHFADRFGRRSALTLSVTLMAAGSLLIAFTPSYATIGAAAPAILLVARLVQGLSVGGEYATSATYLSEVATPGKRGFYSSFQYVTLVAGQLLALGLLIVLQQVLTEQQLNSWGWRIAFIIGAFGAVVAMYLRRSMEESESFLAEKQQSGGHKPGGGLRVLLQHPKACLTVVGLTLGGTISFYTFTTFLQKYMVLEAEMTKDTATMINFVALLIFVVLQPLAGRLSDKIGRRPLLTFFGVGATLCTVPLLTLLGSTKSTVVAFLIMMAGLVIVTGYTSINAIVKAELFPTKVRALGVGLPYALTVAIFGGTAELFALWLLDIGHIQVYFYYVAGCALISLIVYRFMRETSKDSPLDDGPPRREQDSEAVRA